MPKKMTKKQCESRGHALSEAAEHLKREWSEDPVEIVEGEMVANQLERMAGDWFTKAHERDQD